MNGSAPNVFIKNIWEVKAGRSGEQDEPGIYM